MEGLIWKRNVEEVLDRRRRFFGRRLPDGILVTLPMQLDVEAQWRAFERKWPQYGEGEDRPFPCNEEIFDRQIIALAERAGAEDDALPAVYSILDAGEGMVSAMFGSPMRFIHRPRGPAVSKGQALVADYTTDLDRLAFSLENPWTRRFLGIQDHFREHAAGRFAQYPCLTMDALNFVCEIREASAAYLDVYAEPEGIRRLMEIGLDFNIRFQTAQMERTAFRGEGVPPLRAEAFRGEGVPPLRAEGILPSISSSLTSKEREEREETEATSEEARGRDAHGTQGRDALATGCFVWLADWAPFPRAISLSVDAYVVCSVKAYAEMGFEYQKRLIEHFGHGLMHFHCNRTDLATEVAKLPGLELLQFGGDPRDAVPAIDRIPGMRQAVGDIPLMTDCALNTFLERLDRRELAPNVWYQVHGPPMEIDQANRLMDKVRQYRA